MPIILDKIRSLTEGAPLLELHLSRTLQALKLYSYPIVGVEKFYQQLVNGFNGVYSVRIQDQNINLDRQSFSARHIALQKGARVSLYSCASVPHDNGFKTDKRTEYDRSKALFPNADEVFLCDENGFILEGTTCNIFLAVGGQLITPIMKAQGVRGVMRNYLIQRLPEIGVQVHPSQITKEQLLAADEIFITNAVIGIAPIIEIEQVSYQRGEIFSQVRLFLREHLGNNFLP